MMDDQGYQFPVEIADDDHAPASVRRVYADIRQVLETQVVNLVFRRLAGLGNDVLEQVWTSLRPAYIDGRIAVQAARVANAVTIPETDDKQPFAALDGEQRAIVRALVTNYNRNNARNLAAFSALLGEGRIGETEAIEPRRGTVHNPAPLTIPPLPALSSLTEETQATIARLNRFGEPGLPEVTASLYVHLAHWPTVLESAEGLLAPLETAGALARWREHTTREARHAADLLGGLAAPDALKARIAPVLTPLVDITLPKMIPIGRLLASAIG